MSDRHRILLVDDQDDVRSVMATALSTRFEVVEARDGLEALQKLDDSEPDFAILDARMPVMDGYDLCEAIRRHDKFRGVPVLFLSAFGSKENIARGYQAGCNLFMKKPIDPGRVIKNVDFTIQHEKTPVRKKRYSVDELRKRAYQQAASAQDRRVPPSPLAGPESRESGGAPQGRAAEQRPSRPVAPPPPRSEQVVGPIQDHEELDFDLQEPVEQSAPAPDSDREVAHDESRYAAEAGPEVDDHRARNGVAPTSDRTQGAMAENLTPRVMIVDNEDDMRNLMDIALRTRFEVTTARNGVEAIENIVHYEPDVLILDLMMPKMNGYQLLQSIRRNMAYKHMPVVVVSGKATPRDQNYVLRMGASAFIAKPFKMDQLIETLCEVMSAPEFEVKPKRLPIDEIIEREFLRAKENFDTEDQPDRLRKFAEIQEVINRRKES